MTGQQLTEVPVTGQQFTEVPVTGQQFTEVPVTGQQLTEVAAWYLRQQVAHVEGRVEYADLPRCPRQVKVLQANDVGL